MKALFRWLAKVIGSAISLVLVIVLFPHVSKLAAMVLPDVSGSAIKTSAILASRLEESARLETNIVEEEGVINYDISLLSFSLSNVNIRYQYKASFGIDLTKVKLILNHNELIVQLPEPELLLDSITPLESYLDTYWTPQFDQNDYQKLLEEERVSRRNAYLEGENLAALKAESAAAFEKTIAAWLKDMNSRLKLTYQNIPQSPEKE